MIIVGCTVVGLIVGYFANRWNISLTPEDIWCDRF